MMQAQASLFAVESVESFGYADAVGCSFNHHGAEGVIVAYDTDSYAEPMFIVRFVSGRMGVLRPTEIGAAARVSVLGKLGSVDGGIAVNLDGEGSRIDEWHPSQVEAIS